MSPTEVQSKAINPDGNESNQSGELDAMIDHPIATVIENYLNSIKNIGQTVKIVMPHLSKWHLDEIKKHEKKLANFTSESMEGGDSQKVTLESARDFVEIMSTLRALDELHSSNSLPVLARSLFMQMFCEFDAFMGALLKILYLKNDELLKGISREISLRDLFEFENLEAAKRAMLEKEIETFRLDSYVEQFGTLEKKFQVALKKFDEWPEFVELTQRRNIFTHNDGMTSDQYLTVCEREGWKFDKRPRVGDSLQVDLRYFGRAMQVMSKIGFMLGHTLWSKIYPHEIELVHDSMNSRLYQCLEQKRWLVASEVGSFSLSDPMRRGITEIALRIRVINVSIALKFAERENDARKLLNSFDWTASYRDFKLAILVLQDEFTEAVKIMQSIGKSGEILNQSSYHSWPLFHKFRERPEFYTTYESIYGEPYKTELPKDAQNLSQVEEIGLTIRASPDQSTVTVKNRPTTKKKAERRRTGA